MVFVSGEKVLEGEISELSGEMEIFHTLINYFVKTYLIVHLTMYLTMCKFYLNFKKRSFLHKKKMSHFQMYAVDLNVKVEIINHPKKDYKP